DQVEEGSRHRLLFLALRERAIADLVVAERPALRVLALVVEVGPVPLAGRIVRGGVLAGGGLAFGGRRGARPAAAAARPGGARPARSASAAIVASTDVFNSFDIRRPPGRGCARPSCWRARPPAASTGRARPRSRCGRGPAPRRARSARSCARPRWSRARTRPR